MRRGISLATRNLAAANLKEQNSAHLTRTRHAYRVTLLTLHILQREAFLICNGSEHEETDGAWRLQMIAKSPTFMFWDLILRYETLILIFVRAHRERNFHLYVNVLEELRTSVLCLRPCQLRKVATRSYKRYEIFASANQRKRPIHSLEFRSIKHTSKKTPT